MIEKLLQGNQRFSQGQVLRSDVSVTRRQQIANLQQPFAMVLACSDSRVPPEIIFDCGLGDLFVIRTAGHTIDNAVRESVLFGIQSLRIPLIVVLGHARCGAVSLAIDNRKHATGDGNASWLVEQIAPAIEQCENHQDLLSCVIKLHVKVTVERLRNLIKPLAVGVRLIGSFYDLDTGTVEILKT